jgi:hypothetical protein
MDDLTDISDVPEVFAIDFKVVVLLIVAACLVTISIAMLRAHVVAWRAYQAAQGDEAETGYRRRQFRRRMQMSAMLGFLALGLAAGHFLVLWVHSNRFELAYWLVAMLVAVWLGLLAMVDIWATQRHFSRQRDAALFEEIRKNIEAKMAEDEDR